MAIFLLDNVGASVTGTPVDMNGGIRVVNVEATNYGTGAGVILECKLDTTTIFVPLTRLGVPASITTDQSIIIRLAPVGYQLRARTDVGCVGVTVTMLPAGQSS